MGVQILFISSLSVWFTIWTATALSAVLFIKDNKEVIAKDSKAIELLVQFGTTLTL